MDSWTLALVGGALAAPRLAFLALHMRDLDGLWSDYAHGGLRYHLARGLDYLTLAIFTVTAAWALWATNWQQPDLARIFVAGLGFSILERLPVHRFPRTNQPGALDEAKVTLIVHVLLSILGAAGLTLLAAACAWWRG